jgi:hypothetical protein
VRWEKPAGDVLLSLAPAGRLDHPSELAIRISLHRLLAVNQLTGWGLWDSCCVRPLGKRA